MSRTREKKIQLELFEFARAATGRDGIGPDTRLVQDLNLLGDDIEEFLETVAGRYGTDFSGLVWHRHYPDEYSAAYYRIGQAFRRFFHRPDAAYEPITIARLATAVSRGRWSYDGPQRDEDAPGVKLWLHTVAYLLGPAPVLAATVFGWHYGDTSPSGLASDPLFYVLAGVFCLSPAAGLGLSAWLYKADRPHRAPTLFLMIVHGFFLALALLVAAALALGY